MTRPLLARLVFIALAVGVGTLVAADWTATWTAWPQLPPPRTFAAATFLPDTCEMLAFGGRYQDEGVTVLMSRETLLFDSNLGLWDTPTVQKRGGPPGLLHAGLSWDPMRKVAVMFGGYAGLAQNRAWGFDPWSRKWSELGENGPRCDPPKCPPPRYFHEQAWSSALSATLVFGGREGGSPLREYDDLWALRAHPGRRGGLTWVWSKLDPSGDRPVARWGHGMAEIQDGSGKVLIYGGSRRDGASYVRLSDTWLYDPWINEYELVDVAPPTPRGGFAIGYSPSLDAIVIQGGYDASGQSTHETWAFDHVGLRWAKVASAQDLPGDRSYHNLVSDSCGGTGIIFEQPDALSALPRSPMWALK